MAVFLLLQVNQEIEVRPGIVSKDSEGKLQCRAIFSRIVSLFAEQNDLQFAVPGGLIGEYLLVILLLKSVFCNIQESCYFVQLPPQVAPFAILELCFYNFNMQTSKNKAPNLIETPSTHRTFDAHIFTVVLPCNFNLKTLTLTLYTSELYMCMFVPIFILFTNFFFSGVGTKIDPTLCRADRMVGQVWRMHLDILT